MVVGFGRPSTKEACHGECLDAGRSGSPFLVSSLTVLCPRPRADAGRAPAGFAVTSRLRLPAAGRTFVNGRLERTARPARHVRSPRPLAPPQDRPQEDARQGPRQDCPQEDGPQDPREDQVVKIELSSSKRPVRAVGEQPGMSAHYCPQEDARQGPPQYRHQENAPQDPREDQVIKIESLSSKRPV